MKEARSAVPIKGLNIHSEYASYGRIVPRIYGFLGKRSLPSDVKQSLVTTRWLADVIDHPDDDDDGIHIPTYLIRRVESLSDNDAAVYFSLSYEQFDDYTQTESINDQFPNVLHRMVLPKAYIALLRGMFRGDDDASIRVFDGEPRSLQENHDEPDIPVINIRFPPEAFTRTWRTLTPQLLQVSLGFYAEDNAARIEGSETLRRAQHDLMKIYVALGGGEIAKGWDYLNSLTPYFSVDENGHSPLTGTEAEYAYILNMLIKEVYNNTVPDSEWASANLDQSEDAQHIDETFRGLMSFNSMEASLRTIDANSPYYRATGDAEQDTLRDPFIHGIPTELLAITEHITSTNPAVIELARWDMTRDAVLDNATEKFGLPAARMAMVLVAVARIKKALEMELAAGDFTSLTVRILTIPGDSYPWEISTFNSYLCAYETQDFVKLLRGDFDDSDDPHDAVYLVVAMLQVIEQVGIEGWTTENVDERLSSVLQSPEIGNVATLIKSIIASAQEDDDPGHVLHDVLSNHPLNFLVNTVAVSIPALADYAAFMEEVVVGTAEWRNVREAYVDEFMSRMGRRLSRTLDAGEDEEDEYYDEDDDF